MEEHLHLSSHGLLYAAYGIAEDKGWRDCPQCRAAVDEMSRCRDEDRRRPMEAALPEWFWLRQRQSVVSVAAAAASHAPRFRWGAIGALAAMAVAGWLAMTPGTAPAARIAKAPAAQIAMEDERLLTDVSTAVNRVEPRALAPLDILWTQ